MSSHSLNSDDNLTFFMKHCTTHRSSPRLVSRSCTVCVTISYKYSKSKNNLWTTATNRTMFHRVDGVDSFTIHWQSVFHTMLSIKFVGVLASVLSSPISSNLIVFIPIFFFFVLSAWTFYFQRIHFIRLMLEFVWSNLLTKLKLESQNIFATSTIKFHFSKLNKRA